MLPLPFSRYAELFNVDVQKGDLGFVLSNYARNSHFLRELNDLLEKYLVTGGFPNAIRDIPPVQGLRNLLHQGEGGDRRRNKERGRNDRL